MEDDSCKKNIVDGELLLLPWESRRISNNFREFVL